MIQKLIDAWRRRWWRPDPAALAAFAGLRPMTVVTGGSEGIGFALARRFAEAGSDVMLVARRAEPLARAAERIRSAYKVKAIAVPLDVTASDAIATLDAALAANGAYADVLVNSAGIGFAGRFDEQAPDQLMRLVDLNVCALTALSRHYVAGMRLRGRGGILNLASIGGYVPGAYQAAYYASKAYVLALSEALAVETRGKGVRVCALAPGSVNTAFHARMGARHAAYQYVIWRASPESVAYAGYSGFMLGWRVVVPGILPPVMALALRAAPHRLMIPIVGWLLRPRGAEAGNAGR
jgi:uncharacterized protein